VIVAAVPVRLPLKVVAVMTPVTTAPLVRVGAPSSFLLTIVSTCSFDIFYVFSYL
jgi:hypothetical protein